ncbi:unnamed protein product [Protopolystoma xenopodis]|uniref:Uncharacterized protein n=1 Tax=Protopolystoma xenopodis TaxID=117903 RepID=A0A3S5AN28_9PLAT|nr:unnamed protein product [Protopolystoma xenopodis]
MFVHEREFASTLEERIVHSQHVTATLDGNKWADANFKGLRLFSSGTGLIGTSNGTRTMTLQPLISTRQPPRHIATIGLGSWG